MIILAIHFEGSLLVSNGASLAVGGVIALIV